jgi:hypothetical protein
LTFALILLLRLGLPITAFFVAFNPMWVSAGTSTLKAGRLASIRS